MTEEAASQEKLSKSIVLVGLMGCGKSSIGVRLANRLGVAFIDSDNEIEAAANMTIPEIFERYGEDTFRSGERRVIARLLEGPSCVIATGGGAFMDADTRAVIKKHAVSVWLRAELDVLVQRTSGRTHRPLLNSGDPREILGELMKVRYPIYAEADITVDSVGNQTHEKMVTRIEDALTANRCAFGTIEDD